MVTMLQALPEGQLPSDPSQCTGTLRDLRELAPILFAGGPVSAEQKASIVLAISLEIAERPTFASEIFEFFEWPLPFPLVLREELQQIDAGRKLRNSTRVPTPPPGADAHAMASDRKLVGLAFSGGGIRSATVNLGILQRLAEHGFLDEVDYLSTVSGGGYIGAWFASWVKRKGFGTVTSTLRDMRGSDPNCPEFKAIRYLRQYSNYLTPQLGVLSLDTWSMVAIYCRNVLLNLAILITGFGALLLLPRFVGLTWIADPLQPCLSRLLAGSQTTWRAWWELVVGVLLFVAGVLSIGQNLRQATKAEAPEPGDISEQRDRYGPVSVQLACLAPLLLSMLFLSLWIWTNVDNAAVGQVSRQHWTFWAIVFAFFAALATVLSKLGNFWQCAKRRLNWSVADAISVYLVSTIATALAGCLLLRGYVIILHYLANKPDGRWHAIVWGPPLLFVVVGLAAIVLVGTLGVDFEDAGREWLARLRAAGGLYCAAWIAVYAAPIYGPAVFAALGKWVSALSLGWLGTTLASLLIGASGKTGQSREGVPIRSKLQIIAKIGPPVFAIGFIWAIALSEDMLLGRDSLSRAHFFSSLRDTHWRLLESSPLEDGSAICFAVLAITAIVLAWRVDINEFSMHHFYKNRLVRCYLGATSPNRRPNLFTGFDKSDDIYLSALKADGRGKPYEGPYHIVNATLNISAGRNLAWQERKAASFILTPCFSGFDLKSTQEENSRPSTNDLRSEARRSGWPCAYRRTEKYAMKGGLGLGTAIAISGAAADPNQGFETAPAVAFLMTVFDVRLGWWLGNSRKDKESQLSSPRFGLAALISELLGSTDDRTNFINLSDGGHFDNMALYELVRRRCRYIVVCDAEQDSSYTFGGLGMAIRKCRIDFGAEIDINPQQIIPRGEKNHSESHCAVGKITYVDKTEGTLVYMKASLTGDEPGDVLQYAASRAAFPHESTGDQWFTESQFESYRKLGYHIADSTFGPAKQWMEHMHHTAEQEDDRIERRIHDLFLALSDHWYPINPELNTHALKHTNRLHELFVSIGTNSKLHALGLQLFPVQKQPDNVPPGDPIQEFYTSMMLLQLVEDIYFDFKLEDPKWQRDPRIDGWMHLFGIWSNTPAVKAAWASQKETFRKDFRVFWENIGKRDQTQ